LEDYVYFAFTLLSLCVAYPKQKLLDYSEYNRGTVIQCKCSHTATVIQKKQH